MHKKKLHGSKDGGRAMAHRRAAHKGRRPPFAHLKYRTAIAQTNLLSTRLSLPKWRQIKGKVEEWTKDIMMNLQWRPCHVWGLLVSLHSAIQATNSRESLSNQTPSQMIPVSRVSYYINTDSSSTLLPDVFLETRILLFKCNPSCKPYSCPLHLCR